MNSKFFRGISFVIALMIGISFCNKKTEELVYPEFYSTNVELDDDLVCLLENDYNIDILKLDNEKLLLSAIYENNNLNDSEKCVFYDLVDLIIENDYFDEKEAYKRLSSVDIVYLLDEYDGFINGSYSYADNTINIYNNNDRTKYHEAIHSLIYSRDFFKLYSRSFSEGVTELLRLEYCSLEPFVYDESYIYEMTFVKILSEIVGSDVVLAAYSTGDFSLIISKMSLVYGSYKNAASALDILDKSLDSLYNDGNSKYSMKDVSYCFEKLDEYVNSNKEIIDIDSYNYNRNLFISMYKDVSYDNYLNYISTHGVLEKGYFSKDLVNLYSMSNFKRDDLDKVLVK